MFRCTSFSDDLYTAFPIFTEKTQDLLLKAIHRSLSSRYIHVFVQSLSPYVNEHRFLMQGKKASPGRPWRNFFQSSLRTVIWLSGTAGRKRAEPGVISTQPWWLPMIGSV